LYNFLYLKIGECMIKFMTKCIITLAILLNISFDLNAQVFLNVPRPLYFNSFYQPFINPFYSPAFNNFYNSPYYYNTYPIINNSYLNSYNYYPYGYSYNFGVPLLPNNYNYSWINYGRFQMQSVNINGFNFYQYRYWP